MEVFQFMIKSSISADMLGLSLRQMGANIQVNSSKILFVEFKISEKLTVSYFCNIRDEDQVYLQRIEPYPVRNFRFEEVENILKFIKIDVTLFANASQSSNFPLFLDIIDANYYVRKEIEHLFLLKNVPHGLLEDLLKKNNDILEQIKNSKTPDLAKGIVPYTDEEHYEVINKHSIEGSIDEYASSHQVTRDRNLHKK